MPWEAAQLFNSGADSAKEEGAGLGAVQNLLLRARSCVASARDVAEGPSTVVVWVGKKELH